MILADVTTNWMMGTTIASCFCTVAAVVISLVALNKKQEVRVEQPVSVTITEELHKVFAAKETFEKHVEDNTRAHEGFATQKTTEALASDVKSLEEKLFSKIGGVERGAAASLERKVEIVSKDLIHIGNQVAGLKTQTDLQNQQLARMDSKLDRLAERKL